MDVNQILPSHARQIVGRCLLAGTEVPFVLFDVDNNSFGAADTFSVTFAVSALPASFSLLKWWADQTSIEVEIHVEITASGQTSKAQLIVGDVDTWHFNPARMEVVAEGRDFTGRLIDAKSAGESFKNYTSSEIASMLAKRHGLTPVVTATTGKFGEFYQIDSTHLSGEQSEWEILTTLAGFEGMQVYVSGNELHFEPQADPAQSDQYLIQWTPPGDKPYPQANVADDLQFERALTIAKGITVQVLSWHSRHKKTVPTIASYPKNAKSVTPGGSTPKTQTYRIIRNGLTPAQAMDMAEKIYRQIIQHEMKVSGSMPGDNLLTPQTIIRVEGTNSPFDQLYYCDSVRRSLSVDEGYRMSFTAKNHNPNTQVSG
ncbi:type IV secretion protein Rhs [Aquitalea magnusonii]|uniref:Type IV secretion protein Rhs n=1 Tax=Aquitalea aquatica TaxID=3044273 RepID=A0A838YHM9_9NEIS|nr:type IV secretion protein Rhs [Aquitalea magnusonii]